MDYDKSFVSTHSIMEGTISGKLVPVIKEISIEKFDLIVEILHDLTWERDLKITKGSKDGKGIVYLTFEFIANKKTMKYAIIPTKKWYDCFIESNSITIMLPNEKNIEIPGFNAKSYIEIFDFNELEFVE